MSVEIVPSVAARARVHAALGDPARLAIVDALAWADCSPGELGRLVSAPTNLLAHHLQVLESAGVIVRGRSEGDRRRSYVRLVPAAVAGLGPAGLGQAARVVFVCTHNSARSQFAAALWARSSQVPVASAGTDPAGRVHPRAVAVARRHGLSLRRARPVRTDDVVQSTDLVVAVCDKAFEQWVGPGGPRLHWSVPDPARVDTDEAFEQAFQDIAGRVQRLAPAIEPERAAR